MKSPVTEQFLKNLPSTVEFNDLGEMAEIYAYNPAADNFDIRYDTDIADNQLCVYFVSKRTTESTLKRRRRQARKIFKEAEAKYVETGAL